MSDCAQPDSLLGDEHVAKYRESGAAVAVVLERSGG